MACVGDPGVVAGSSNTLEVVRLKMMRILMIKARKLMMVTRVMVGNRSVG